jgi:hypothetical protein
MVEVHLPDVIARRFRGRPRKVTLEADSVHYLLMRLDREWPGLMDRVRTTDPKIRPHVEIFVDGALANLDTLLRDGSLIEIIPVVPNRKLRLVSRH